MSKLYATSERDLSKLHAVSQRNPFERMLCTIIGNHTATKKKMSKMWQAKIRLKNTLWDVFKNNQND